MKIFITKEELSKLLLDSESDVAVMIQTDLKQDKKIELEIRPKVPEVRLISKKDEPKPTPTPTPTPKPKRRKKIDHGKIVACYKGGRSVSWIADEMNISPTTVVNHLIKEGIYKKI